MKISIELTEEDLKRYDLFGFLAMGEGVKQAATTQVAPTTQAAVTTQAEPEPEPEPEGPTMDDAVQAATDAVAAGQTAAVKAALASVNTKRVSELAPENIAAFLDALSV